MNKIISIQYLRALAAMGVVMFHSSGHSRHWFEIGGAGVDLFFIISGFIMFTVTENRESDPKLFFWRRLIRIVPLYWCATLLTALMCLIRPWLVANGGFSFSHVIMSLFFIPSPSEYEFDNQIISYPTLLQGWTLNIEMFFYIVVSLSLFFERRLQIRLISALLLCLVVLGAYFQPESAILKAYSSSLLLEFAAGLWIGYFWAMKQLPGRSAGIYLLIGGLSAFCIEQVFDIHGTDALRPLYSGIPALLIILGALSIEANGGIIQLPLLKVLGDASYSIYLLHMLVIGVVNYLKLPIVLQSCADIFLAAAGGICTFYFFEVPVNAFFAKLQFSDSPRIKAVPNEIGE